MREHMIFLKHGQKKRFRFESIKSSTLERKGGRKTGREGTTSAERADFGGTRSRPQSYSFPGFVDLMACCAASKDSSWFCPKDRGLPGRKRINGTSANPWGGQNANWKCADERFPAKSLTSRHCLRCSWRGVTDSTPRTVPALLLTPSPLRAVQRRGHHTCHRGGPLGLP